MQSSHKRLFIDGETTIRDIVEFAGHRLERPVLIDGAEGEIEVYNLHNSQLDTAELLEWSQTAQAGCYAVPYQVSGVWAVMHQILPERVRNARTLVYQQGPERYVDYPSWTLDTSEREQFRAELAQRLPADDDDN